jgi:uncharacterized protein YutE (UPF0331/DUF86 family)
MVRRDVAANKIARAGNWLDQSDALLRQPIDVFLANVKDRDLAAFYLLLAVQEAVDLAAHVVADAGWGPPDDAGSAFDLLADNGVLERPLADSLRGAVGLRNLIAHGYARLDHQRVHAEAGSGIHAIRTFLAHVADFAGL